MLLKENFQRLITLGLGQAEFFLTRRIFASNEALAKKKQQLKFLQRCSEFNVFPTTIQNLHFPTILNTTHSEGFRTQTKRNILNKSKKQLRRTIAQDYHKQRELDCQLTSVSTPQTVKRIRTQNYLVYNTSSKLHGDRLKQKFDRNFKKQQPERYRQSHGSIPIPATTDITQNHTLVTDLTNTLNDDEINLLAKGPKFNLAEGVNDNTINDLYTGFYRLVNCIRWREHNKESHNATSTDETTLRIPYPKTNYIKKPESTPTLEDSLKRVHHEFQSIIQSIHRRPKHNNLTVKERQVLAGLKKKDNIYLPSDKGGEFCVIDLKTYNDLAIQHLENPANYCKVARMTTKTIERKINPIWKNICQKRNIPKHIQRSYISNNTTLPYFYHLIKTHKLAQGTKIRPIVSNTNGPTTRLCWLLARTLKPLLKHVPAHLENSMQLIERIQRTEPEIHKRTPYPYSLDVVSLYTSIPTHEAIEATIEQLPSKTGPFTTQDIEELLTVLLQNTYFHFQQQIFLQTSGLPMGSSLSGILAILFMHRLESGVLNTYQPPTSYSRYVDDTYNQAPDEQGADEFHLATNSAHPKIKFEIEKPIQSDNGLSLALLDFKVTIKASGDMEFDFYRKSARKSTFVHYKSAIPGNTKRNIIKNEINRIRERCSTQESRERNHKSFLTILSLNGYPANFADNLHRPNKTKYRHRKSITPTEETQRLKEAIQIRNKQPCINSREECTELLDILF